MNFIENMFWIQQTWPQTMLYFDGTLKQDLSGTRAYLETSGLENSVVNDRCSHLPIKFSIKTANSFPMGPNCTPLIAAFLFCYERNIIPSLCYKKLKLVNKLNI